MPISADKFLSLTARQFENLIFDLAKLLGLQNLTWRTPGADGGRDIEGELPVYDLSGSVNRQRWFIECKRYEPSIDWPTVWKKIAFADSNGADFLLIATTSTLSPACETEVSKWNSGRRHPIVRSWNVYELGHVLERFPSLALLYNLVAAPADRDRGFSSLASEVSGLTQTAYSAAEFSQNSKPALEAAAALAELLSARMTDFSVYGRLNIAPYEKAVDGYDWQDRTFDAKSLDRFGVRAAMSSFRLVTRASKVTIVTNSDCVRAIAQDGIEVPQVSIRLFDLISVWSGFELSISKDAKGKSTMAICLRKV